MLLIIKSKPNTIKGMPIGAVTTNTVRTIPTIIKATPRIPAINLPVSFRIELSKFHKATKGQARSRFLHVIPSIRTKPDLYIGQRDFDRLTRNIGHVKGEDIAGG